MLYDYLKRNYGQMSRWGNTIPLNISAHEDTDNWTFRVICLNGSILPSNIDIIYFISVSLDFTIVEMLQNLLIVYFDKVRQ